MLVHISNIEHLKIIEENTRFLELEARKKKIFHFSKTYWKKLSIHVEIK